MVMVMSQKSIAIFGKKQRLLSIDMKTKVVQHVRRIIFNVFKVFEFSSFQVFRFSGYQVFQNIPGSQLLSDIQTFLAWNQLYFQVFKFLFFGPSSTRQVWHFKF